MASVLYRCAATGQNVQVWFADDVPDDSVYVSLRCPACAEGESSSSASRFTAGASGFLSLSQSLVRPDIGAQAALSGAQVA
jgi:hypothetical protein